MLPMLPLLRTGEGEFPWIECLSGDRLSESFYNLLTYFFSLVIMRTT